MLTLLCPLPRTKLLLRPARTPSELEGHTGQGRGGWSQVCSGFGVILTVRSHDPQCQLAEEALQGQSTEWPGCLLMIISSLNFTFFLKKFLHFHPTIIVASTLSWFLSLYLLFHVLYLFPSLCPADLASWGSGLVTRSKCHCVVSQRWFVSWHWILAAQLPSSDL